MRTDHLVFGFSTRAAWRGFPGNPNDTRPDMKAFTRPFATVLGLLAALATQAQAQTTIIADSFNRTGPIADSAPDTADANAPGNWSVPDGSDFWNTSTDGGGRLVYSGTTAGITRLPFAPQPGYVYTLGVTINIAATAQDMWMNFGFDNGNTGAGSPAGLSGPWSLVKPSGAVECFFNGTGTTIASLPPGTANRGGTNNLMQMVLDTTGNNWSMRLLVNGTQRASRTFVGQPAIAGIVLGHYSGGNQLGATNTALTLTAIQPTAPEISIQPVGLTNWAGKAAEMTVAASGAQPITYQWRKNGADLPGEVNDTLVFPALTGADSGNYTVVVANDLGAVTSQVAVAYVETGTTLQYSPSLALVQLPPTETDAASGIAVTNLYLAALDFGLEPTPIEIGGVPFQRIDPAGQIKVTGVDPVHGGTWEIESHSGIGSAATAFGSDLGDAGGVSDPSGGVFLLLSDASYDTSVVPLDFITAKLGGLTPGAQYSLRYYYRQRDLEPGRPVTFTFDGHGTNETLRTDLDTGGAYYLRYNFTAVASAMQMTLTANASGKSPILYGLTLQQTSAPPVPPSITAQPAGFTNWVGLSGSVNVSASGSLPLSFQWFRNGAKIDDATGPAISFASLLGDETGNYMVVVTNNYGAVTSAVTRVEVVTDGVMELGPSFRIVQLPAAETDAASGIWPTNIYLSALDFGNDTAALTVNEVPFQQVSLPGAPNASGTDATHGGTWSMTARRGTNNLNFANHGAATTEADGSMASLLADFSYTGGTIAGDTASLTLGRLVPGGEYAVRYYYRRWSGNRPIRFSFDGHGTNEVVTTDIDLGGAYYLEYRFTAASTNVTGRFEALQVNNGPHIYAVTLHQTAAPPVPPSIVTQPAGVTNWAGLNSTLSVQADGALPLHYQWFKGGTAIGGATTATLSLPGLSEADAASYYVVVTNVTGSITSAVAQVVVETDGVMTLSPTLAILQLPATGTDAATGIDATNTYLAALDFGSDTAPQTVNGVVFQQLNLSGRGTGAAGNTPLHSGTDATYGGTWSLSAAFTGTGGFASHNAGTDQADGTMASLLADFTYLSGTVLPGDNATLTLGGLAPGGNYTLRIYYRRWDVNRPMEFTFNGHGTNEVVRTDIDLGGAYALDYTFTAASTNVSAKLVAGVAGNGPHIYAATLQQNAAAPATVTLLHTRNGSSLILSWDPGLTGYALESSPVLPAVQWEPVPSVQNNSVTVDTSTGLRFYRLKKQ